MATLEQQAIQKGIGGEFSPGDWLVDSPPAAQALNACQPSAENGGHYDKAEGYEPVRLVGGPNQDREFRQGNQSEPQEQAQERDERFTRV